MNDLSKNLWLKIHDAAKRAAPLYVQDMLTVETLSQLMAQEWVALYLGEYGDSQKEGQDGEEKEAPLSKTVWRLAQRLCSRELHNSWCSSDEHLHERAYINLARYFTRLLHHVHYTDYLQMYDQATEDAVNQTLEELYKLRKGEKKLDDPAAFIKWSQVILHRKALAILNKRKGEENTESLEQRLESGSEEFTDPRNRDPMVLVIEDELRGEIENMLATMRNKKYVQVLILQFLEDRDDSEIAQIMEIKIETVRLWRHRAFRWLRRKNLSLEKLLRFLSD